MKFSYKFSNLCGTVYKCGNVCYSADGTVLYSPVGNRISVFDLVNHTSYTLPFETRKNVSRICVSNNGRYMIAVDVDGKALFVNLKRRVVLYRFSFEGSVQDICFSPDDSMIAVAIGRKFQLWYTPTEQRHFAPLERCKETAQHFDTITCIRWSPDGKYLVTGSEDMNVRLFSVDRYRDFYTVTLTGHRSSVLGAYFSSDGKEVYSVCADGGVLEWKWSEVDDETWERMQRFIDRKLGHVKSGDGDERGGEDGEDGEDEEKEKDGEEKEEEEKEEENEEKEDNGEDDNDDDNDNNDNNNNNNTNNNDTTTDTTLPSSTYTHGHWTISARHSLEEHGMTVTSCDFNASARLLVLGLSSGLFALYELPGFTRIHSLSISRNDVTSCVINRSGDWLAFGCASLGQLLVWEWQSETYVLKQQGHYYSINALEFSPDGAMVATGGDDGKVKLWSVSSGFCFVTFADHTAAVNDLCYVRGGHALLSASSDGTVRAYDLIRYRNFRTLTTPTPVQFTCVTCDASGDLIAAGASAPFEIYIWSLRTGRLLDTLTGHEGPISCLRFNARGTQLASGSWDHTVRTWDLLGSGLKESLEHPAEVVSLDWRRDDDELIASCLNGSVFIWDAANAVVKGTIDGRRDLSGGRKSSDVITAEQSMAGKFFRSVCYSADGEFMIGGGRSPYLCIYELRGKSLVRKFAMTHNRSLEGVLTHLNSNQVTEAGAASELPGDESLSLSHVICSEDPQFLVPGALKGDGAKRSLREEIYCNAVKFAPSGELFAAASSQGLMIFSLDPSLAFDPFDLHEDVTPEAVNYALAGEEWSRALIYALHLNETACIRQVLQSVPFDMIQVVSSEVPRLFLARLLQVLCEETRTTPYLEYYVCWLTWLLKLHGQYLRANPRRYMSVLRMVQKCVLEHYNACRSLADSTIYTLRFLSETSGKVMGDEVSVDGVDDNNTSEKQEAMEEEYKVDESMTHF